MSASGTENTGTQNAAAAAVAQPTRQSPDLGPTQQYMREQAEAAIRRHNEELAWARRDPRHPLYEHAPVLTYDPQSTLLEQYYANLQIIAQVELSRGIIYPRSYALVEASLLGPYELQLEMIGQSNKMRMIEAATRQGDEDIGCASYIDENGCVQPSGEALWWILKSRLDFKWSVTDVI